MVIKAVFFDLDGTLLPMEQECFVKAYFGAISKELAVYGYEPEKLIDTIWKGTEKMVSNNGSMTNEKAFWSHFISVYGERVKNDFKYFDAFYENSFDKISSSCGYNPIAAEVITLLKQKGIRLILATNPIFPRAATERRVAWAGLSYSDFELVTTYENSSFCKPSLNYYKEILSKIAISPDEVLMVGNDVGEDMIAADLGMKVFLLTDNLINKKNTDISIYPHGGFVQLIDFIRKI